MTTNGELICISEDSEQLANLRRHLQGGKEVLSEFDACMGLMRLTYSDSPIIGVDKQSTLREHASASIAITPGRFKAGTPLPILNESQGPSITVESVRLVLHVERTFTRIFRSYPLDIGANKGVNRQHIERFLNNVPTEIHRI